MKKSLNIRILICAALFVSICAGSFSCSDWTDDESLGIKEVGLDQSGFYQDYLANLRSYKKTDHKIMMGWFDNSNKNPFSMGQRLSALPDSVDFVSLMHPDNLAAWEISEMKALKKDKGTRVIYTIDCDAMTSEYNAIVIQNDIDGVPTTTTLHEYLENGINGVTGLMDKYAYDGVCLSYFGQSYDFLTPAKKAELGVMQDMIFGKFNAVMNSHPDGLYLYQGAPVNIINKTYLEPMKYIVVDTSLETGVLRAELLMANLLTGNDVPTDRIVVTARSMSPTDEKVGFYLTEEFGEDPLPCVVELAKWMAAPARYGKSGICVFYINDSYYNALLDYKDVREAIALMNPSPKN